MSPAFPPTAMLDLRTEDRAKDTITFRLGAKRRYVLTALLGAAGLAAAVVGVVPVSVGTVLAIAGTAFVLNYLLTTLATGMLASVWWMRYAVATLDVALISAVVAVLRQDALIILYFLVIVPYSFDRGKALGYFTALSSAVGFVIVRSATMTPGTSGYVYGWILATAALLVVVASQLIPITSRLIWRIRRTREVMAEAEQGNLLVRADGRYSDELGLLQRSFNRMLEVTGQLIGTVQHEADEVAALAERLASATGSLSASGIELATTALDLTEHLESQRQSAIDGAQRSEHALGMSERLRERAAAMETDVHALVEAGGQSRSAIGRASTMLVTISDRVRSTALTVSALGSASEQVNEFVDESGRAAKEVADTMSLVRENIAAAVASMGEGDRDVRDVGTVAGEADRELGGILDGIRRIAEVVAETASVSR